MTALAAKNVTQAALQKYKMEAAKELGIPLNGSKKLSRKQAGQIGGQVVRKMVRAYEKKSK
ncbi:MAG: alpha/beta-type small acid-soluble spore protein [Oscillospiraceae bacterium]|nr:alpha/beta-type small acid-soluble spore protein [Oscillospiraceae bacterium]